MQLTVVAKADLQRSQRQFCNAVCSKLSHWCAQGVQCFPVIMDDSGWLSALVGLSVWGAMAVLQLRGAVAVFQDCIRRRTVDPPAPPPPQPVDPPPAPPPPHPVEEDPVEENPVEEEPMPFWNAPVRVTHYKTRYPKSVFVSQAGTVYHTKDQCHHIKQRKGVRTLQFCTDCNWQL